VNIQLRRLPQKLEHRELRIVYWSTLITLLRVAHASRFPNRSFGKELQLIIIYGAVILAFLEGRNPTIASIARYLQLPHESTRRYLKTIVDLGLLAKNGRSPAGFVPRCESGPEVIRPAPAFLFSAF
jgi:hypothetical protein